MDAKSTRRDAAVAAVALTTGRDRHRSVDCLQAEGPAYLLVQLLETLEVDGCRWRERWGVLGLWDMRWNAEHAFRIDVVGDRVPGVVKAFEARVPSDIVQLNYWPGLGNHVKGSRRAS